MWYVYILLCDDDSLYTGASDDPEKRLVAHQNGKGARYTRLHKPKKIIYTEHFPTKSEALKREMEIKGWSRTQKIENLGLKEKIVH